MENPHEIKSIIRAILISNPLKTNVLQLQTEFFKNEGYDFPCAKTGHSNFIDYLRSIPDTVKVIGSGPNAEVRLVLSKKSAHIAELVSKQRINANKRSSHGQAFNPYKAQRAKYALNPATPNSHYNCDYKTNRSWKDSIDSSLFKYSISTFKTVTNSIKEEETLRTVLDFDDSYRDEMTTMQAKNLVLNVPSDIQTNLRALIIQFPEGMSCSRLDAEYRSYFKSNFDVTRYGYNSVREMCVALPNIFKVVKNNYSDYKLFPVNDVEEISSDDTIVPEDDEDLRNDTALLPPNIMRSSEFIEQEEITAKVGEYLAIDISEVYDPSKFWFCLHKNVKKLDALMDDMQKFYHKHVKRYAISFCALREGLYCTAIFMGDYHRAIIRKVLSPSLIKVFYIDYGTVDKVSKDGICYLHKQFTLLPAQAIRGRLAKIHPPKKEDMWSPESSLYLTSWIRDKELMAEIISIEENTEIFELVVTDTKAMKDTCINEDLVLRNYARFDKEGWNGVCNYGSYKPSVKNIHLYPTFEEIERGLVPSLSDLLAILKTNLSLANVFPQYFQDKKNLNNKNDITRKNNYLANSSTSENEMSDNMKQVKSPSCPQERLPFKNSNTIPFWESPVRIGLPNQNTLNSAKGSSARFDLQNENTQKCAEKFGVHIQNTSNSPKQLKKRLYLENNKIFEISNDLSSTYPKEAVDRFYAEVRNAHNSLTETESRFGSQNRNTPGSLNEPPETFDFQNNKALHSSNKPLDSFDFQNNKAFHSSNEPLESFDFQNNKALRSSNEPPESFDFQYNKALHYLNKPPEVFDFQNNKATNEPPESFDFQSNEVHSLNEPTKSFRLQDQNTSKASNESLGSFNLNNQTTEYFEKKSGQHHNSLSFSNDLQKQNTNEPTKSFRLQNQNTSNASNESLGSFNLQNQTTEYFGEKFHQHHNSLTFSNDQPKQNTLTFANALSNINTPNPRESFDFQNRNTSNFASEQFRQQNQKTSDSFDKFAQLQNQMNATDGGLKNNSSTQRNESQTSNNFSTLRNESQTSNNFSTQRNESQTLPNFASGQFRQQNQNTLDSFEKLAQRFQYQNKPSAMDGGLKHTSSTQRNESQTPSNSWPGNPFSYIPNTALNNNNLHPQNPQITQNPKIMQNPQMIQNPLFMQNPQATQNPQRMQTPQVHLPAVFQLSQNPNLRNFQQQQILNSVINYASIVNLLRTQGLASQFQQQQNRNQHSFPRKRCVIRAQICGASFHVILFNNEPYVTLNELAKQYCGGDLWGFKSILLISQSIRIIPINLNINRKIHEELLSFNVVDQSVCMLEVVHLRHLPEIIRIFKNVNIPMNNFEFVLNMYNRSSMVWS